MSDGTKLFVLILTTTVLMLIIIFKAIMLSGC